MYDRVSGTRTQRLTSKMSEVSLKNKHRIFFLERVGDVIISASPNGLHTRALANLNVAQKMKKSSLKFCKAYVDYSTKTYVAVLHFNRWRSPGRLTTAPRAPFAECTD